MNQVSALQFVKVAAGKEDDDKPSAVATGAKRTAGALATIGATGAALYGGKKLYDSKIAPALKHRKWSIGQAKDKALAGFFKKQQGATGALATIAARAHMKPEDLAAVAKGIGNMPAAASFG